MAAVGNGDPRRAMLQCIRRVQLRCRPTRLTCRGWTGDKGFTTPELNAHALRFLRDGLPPGCTDGFSTSRTCEIGLTDHAGIPYRSIVYLLDTCAVSATP